MCLDCGTRFAEKKLIQAYIAAGLGFFMGIFIAFQVGSQNLAFAILAPFIYGYLFPAIFFGWHYGGRIWNHLGKAVDHTAGTSDTGSFVGAIVMLSIRLTAALFLGIFGGGIVQYRRYRKIVKFHESLSAVPAATGAVA